MKASPRLPPEAGTTAVAPLAVAAALGSVYLIWGSTYLAIRFGLESFPPMLMGAARWLVAGVALYVWRRAQGAPRPSLAHWRAAFLVGGLMIVGGNGLVSIAQQWVPSGLTALLVSAVPLFVAVLSALQARQAPTLRVVVGLSVGVVGLGLLFGADALAGLEGVDQRAAIVGAGLVLLAAFSWANGSMLSRRVPRATDTLAFSAMQMLAGGTLMTMIGLALGEAPRVDLAAASAKSWLALAYLIVFGSWVAYASYVWVFAVAKPNVAATYAFVNPIVAVLLGFWLAAEPLTPRVAVVAALIVAGVALIVTDRAGRAKG